MKPLVIIIIDILASCQQYVNDIAISENVFIDLNELNSIHGHNMNPVIISNVTGKFYLVIYSLHFIHIIVLLYVS